MAMPDWESLSLIIAIFLLAGTVKGVLGFGLPLVSLGLLAVFWDLTTAISVLLLPALVTNVWQASAGGYAGPLWRRLWLFLLMASVTIWLGTAVLSYGQLSSAILGSLLMAYALSGLAGLRVQIARRYERINGVAFGLLNGFCTGMTGNFAFPGLLFLQGIGLSRDQLVQAMGMLFTLSTLVLAAAMYGRGLLTIQLKILSLSAVMPALLGMMIGQRVRRRLSEARFRQVFFIGIAGLGAYIASRSIYISLG